MKILLEKLKGSLPSLLFLFLPLALLPSLCFIIHFFLRLDTCGDLENRIYALQQKSELSQLKKQEGEFFLKKLKIADHYYLDKHLENLTFLEADIRRIQAYIQSNPEDERAKKRMQFLKEGANQLRFSEQNIKNLQGVLEVEEIQQYPVEMNEEDLKKVLSRIEEVAITNYSPGEKAPQMIIKNFELTRKKIQEQEEVYLINLQLIKREGPHE